MERNSFVMNGSIFLTGIYIMNHYTSMFFIMILSGLLSTMNVWVDTWEDIRFSINDVYMVLLMTGWMFFFMGILYREPSICIIGFILLTMCLWCIRNQFMVTDSQYKMGMIPHHSMAVHMSKRLLEKHENQEKNQLLSLVRNIVHNQEREIHILKSS